MTDAQTLSRDIVRRLLGEGYDRSEADVAEMLRPAFDDFARIRALLKHGVAYATHWAGCHEDPRHWRCAILRICDTYTGDHS